MSRLSQMILNKQREGGLTDREVAAALTALNGRDVVQQTYNKWKKGHTPSPMFWPALAQWLEVEEGELQRLAEDAKEAAGSAKIQSFTAFAYVKAHGKISDRKEGKYRFEAFNLGRRRVPDGRYVMSVDTKVMEPVFRVGTQIWIDPSVPAVPGREVIVHSDGFGWIGVLDNVDGTTATISRPAGDPVTVKNIEAIHSIVLSSRVAG